MTRKSFQADGFLISFRRSTATNERAENADAHTRWTLFVLRHGTVFEKEPVAPFH